MDKEKLNKQIKVVKKLLEPKGNIQECLKQVTILIEIFLEYIEEKAEDEVSRRI